VGAGPAALCAAARLHPDEAAPEIRDVVPLPGNRSPGAPARKHLGPGLSKRVYHLGGRPPTPTPAFSLTDISRAAATSPPPRCAGRRAVLHLARLRGAAQDVLGAVASSSGRREPRGRLTTPAPGTSTSRPTSASRCASTRPVRTSRPSHHELRATTSTSAPTRNSTDPVPRQRQRRLPRSDWRHHRAVGDAGVPRLKMAARQERQTASREHRPADVARAPKVAFLPSGC